MQIVLALAVSLHALAAVFWMGSTANLARTGGQYAEILFPRQMVGLAVAVLTGGYLWSQLHTGGFGTYEIVLLAGIACALLAAVLQVAMVGTALKALKAGDEAARKRAGVAHRIAAGLLSLTLVAMVAARYI
ncbi:MAG: hypothetical protein JF615_06555 [Asticcacaulis sp.]|nr:hypothetical protein [Asticcacaulis sp.]